MLRQHGHGREAHAFDCFSVTLKHHRAEEDMSDNAIIRDRHELALALPAGGQVRPAGVVDVLHATPAERAYSDYRYANHVLVLSVEGQRC